ncbi:FCD domain-containing protein [Arthrobacter sp. NPDC089319]|uniref:FCD domain-containing protein n=1 Tax=Arthrobacter sp. NPDC089319 TaxID=3155915 RepID=UPI0034302A11
MWVLKKKSFTPSTCQEYRGEHKAIVEALMRRDRGQAAAAMTQHLASIRHGAKERRWVRPRPVGFGRQRRAG